MRLKLYWQGSPKPNTYFKRTCHSERIEEPEVITCNTLTIRFFAALRMTHLLGMLPKATSYKSVSLSI
jgi:hypothetical protein